MTQQDSRGTGRLNNGLYNATKTAIIEAGAPVEVAEKAALVIARDDNKLPNLGRTNEDQDAVWQAWIYLTTGATND
jgi:hypothetical protein